MNRGGALLGRGRKGVIAIEDAGSLYAEDKAEPLHPHGPSKDVNLFLIGDEGLVLDARQKQVYLLNTTASFVWCCLEEGRDKATTTSDYIRLFKRTRGEARREIAAVLAQLEKLALLTGVESRLAQAGCCDALEEQGVTPSVTAVLPPIVARACYRLFSTVFAVGFCTLKQQSVIHPVLRHLAADPTPESIKITIANTGQCHVVAVNGLEATRCESLSRLAPALKSTLLVEAINRYPFDIYLHAAMLRLGNGALLLPAAPGGGKTCLSAALAVHGFVYHADEVTLLAARSFTARGLPTCLSIKKGAVPLLRPLYPNIDRLPIHERADGKRVKYLPPPLVEDGGELDRDWPVRWVVFPAYIPGKPTEMTRLSVGESMRRMFDQCLALRVELNANIMQQLVSAMSRIDCRQLTYQSLDEAAENLTKLCTGEAGAPTIRVNGG